MNLTIITGRSGSGKTTTLRVLEDEGFNCIDNFPVGLLKSLVEHVSWTEEKHATSSELAVCIDARNTASDLKRFSEFFTSFDHADHTCQIIYLDALDYALVKRFSETRRRHPLTNENTDLRQAIEQETELLAYIADCSDLKIDTTQLTVYELEDIIRTRIIAHTNTNLALIFRSFGFKYGVPVDADFVFDIRCLPNPHRIRELRPLTGLDQPVIHYLDNHPDVQQMYTDIRQYLENWLPRFEQGNRLYMSIAIGCTGGQHRSVYLAEKLGKHFASYLQNVLVRHRERNHD